MFKFVFLISVFIFNLQAKELNVLGVEIESVFNKAGKGLEELIIERVFICMNSTFKLTKVPYGRHTDIFNSSNTYDAVATVPKNFDAKGFRTQSHIKYYNGVSYLVSNNFEVNSFEDLAGKKVMTFLGAQKMFPQLKKMIPKMASYKEVPDQKSHSLSLYNKRVDVVFSDGYIFSNYNKIIRKENDNKIYSQPTKFSLISDPSEFYLYFKKSKSAEAFNKCLNDKKVKYDIDTIVNAYRINQMIN